MVERPKKPRIGRPPGRTHPEAFVVRLPEGTLATWHRAARREGLTVAGMIRAAVAERVERTGARRPRGEESGAPTWDETLGGRIGDLERKRK
jgi:hypothetical protein